jgi:hypothetical protein
MPGQRKKKEERKFKTAFYMPPSTCSVCGCSSLCRKGGRERERKREEKKREEERRRPGGGKEDFLFCWLTFSAFGRLYGATDAAFCLRDYVLPLRLLRSV